MPAPPPETTQTLPRGRPASEPPADNERHRNQSRLCFDNVTFWLLVFIAVLMGVLIFRRLARYKYLLGGEEL